MPDQFYVIDPEVGVDVYATAQEAEDAAQCALEHYRDQSSDGWHEDIAGLEWGRLVTLGHACQCDVVLAEDDETGRLKEKGWDYSCDYTLRPSADELSALRARVAELSTQREQALELAYSLASKSDTLRARVAVLEAEQREDRTALRDITSKHVALEVEASQLRRDKQIAEERIKQLEAPPVVPEGWEVLQGRTGRWRIDAARTQTDEEWERFRAANLRALLWAIENNRQPPHVSDGKVERE